MLIHDVSLLVDGGNLLVGRRPLQAEVLHGEGRVAGLKLQLFAGQEHGAVSVQGECLQGMRYVEVEGFVVDGLEGLVVAALVDEHPSGVVGTGQACVAAVEFPGGGVALGEVARVVACVDAVAVGVHLASCVEEEACAALEVAAVFGVDVAVGGALPAFHVVISVGAGIDGEGTDFVHRLVQEVELREL